MKIGSLLSIGIYNTLKVNFHYLPFSKAIKFPIIISRHTKLRKLRGQIVFNCPIRPGIIRFGFDYCGIIDNRYERSILEIDGSIEILGRASFGAASRLAILNDGKLSIGNNVSFTGRCVIITAKNVCLGDNCIVSWNVMIMDTDFHTIFNTEGRITNENKNIIIGNNVWIGCHCNILKGTVIPSGSIIAANTLVSGRLNENNCIYGGIPAKKIKSNINWER